MYGRGGVVIYRRTEKDMTKAMYGLRLMGRKRVMDLCVCWFGMQHWFWHAVLVVTCVEKEKLSYFEDITVCG